MCRTHECYRQEKVGNWVMGASVAGIGVWFVTVEGWCVEISPPICFTFTHRQRTYDCCHIVINHTLSNIRRYKHTDVSEHRGLHTEDCSSVWEAYAAAGSDGKHPAIPQAPHRPSLSLWRIGGCWFPKGSEAPELEESDLFISGPAFKQLQSNREPVDSAQLVPKQ